MKLNHPASGIIQGRTSRRTYSETPLTDEVRNTIEQLIRDVPAGPFGTPVEFSLISLTDISDRKLKLGTYGFIQGARYFVAGRIKSSKEGFLDYGYSLENLILEFTRMGLGTCWLGGTFNRSEFAKAISLGEGEVIPAITPVGYATSSRGLGDRIIRLGAGSKNRLPAEQLFFNGNIGTPLALAPGHPYTRILEGVRLGPSASNNQPWRVVAEGNLFHFYLSRKPGYQKAFRNVDLQMVDMGIAMSHFEQVALEHRLKPVWTLSAETAILEGLEYVISVLLPQ